MIGVTENFRKIQDLLAKAAADAGRSADHIRLLAVSKKQPVEAFWRPRPPGSAISARISSRKASKRSEMRSRRPDLAFHRPPAVEQNKGCSRDFQWVHTVDRLKIARRLSEQRPADAADLNVCIEVNIDAEESKSGVDPADVQDLATEIAELPRLRLRGLMCLPAIREDFAEQRKPFAALRELLESLNSSGLRLDTLSMGMSADYAAAIHEGATIVRVGTAIFGERE